MSTNKPMYSVVSTQQPAAICAIKTPYDAVLILEAVRVGLVPRVTRRLTGHERNQIRAGTIWVWEEEETNMKRWTDGRRWGASRVGVGGYLVYTEADDLHSESDTIPSYMPIHSSRDPLIKQTFSTTMLHPVTGKTKKFHVVGYSSKHNPHGDSHSSLPGPAQLPLLSTLEIAPGVWPDWEKHRDDVTKDIQPPKKGGGKKRSSKVEAEGQDSPQVSPVISSAGLAVPDFSIRGPGSAPPSYTESRQTSTNPHDAYYPPQMSRSAPTSRSVPPYQPTGPPHLPDDRYHPYRDRPGHYQMSSQPHFYDRPTMHLAPPDNSYPYSAPTSATHSPYQASFRDFPPERSQYQTHTMPSYPSPYTDNPSPYYHPMNPYQQHHPPPHQPPHQPRHPPSRELLYVPHQHMSASPDQSRSPSRSIVSARSGEDGDSGRLTLPPLRVAIDGSGTRHGPSDDLVRQASNSGLPSMGGEGKRELGELSKKVSL